MFPMEDAFQVQNSYELDPIDIFKFFFCSMGELSSHLKFYIYVTMEKAITSESC